MTLDLFSCRREIDDLLAAEDAEGRLQLLGEPFMLIIADDDEDIGFGRGKDLAEGIELLLAAIVMGLSRRRGVARGKIVGLAQGIELVEAVSVAAEGEGLVAAIGCGAAISFLRRRRQHRAMRGADAQNQLSQAFPPRAALPTWPGAAGACGCNGFTRIFL